MKKIISALLVLSCTGCSGIKFNTNFSPYINSQLKSAIVREYTIEQINQFDAVSLGFVTASDCQANPRDDKPSKRSLESALKNHVHDLGGNGLVIEACGRQQSAGCLVFLECRGVAYSVPERKSAPNSSGDSTSPRAALPGYSIPPFYEH